MTILHIEHAISDYPTWRQAFDRFQPAREQAGVRGHRVLQPVDDARYVVVDLDFDDRGAATSFLDFLRSVIWADTRNSPALVGDAVTRLLEEPVPADVGGSRPAPGTVS